MTRLAVYYWWTERHSSVTTIEVEEGQNPEEVFKSLFAEGRISVETNGRTLDEIRDWGIEGIIPLKEEDKPSESSSFSSDDETLEYPGIEGDVRDNDASL